jgi:secreted trypsin-like serine protease
MKSIPRTGEASFDAKSGQLSPAQHSTLAGLMAALVESFGNEETAPTNAEVALRGARHRQSRLHDAGRGHGGRRDWPGLPAVRVFETTATHFRVGPQPALSCAGDSGGPALAEIDGVERVVGVASYGDPICIAAATYARLDIDLAGFVIPGTAQLE